MLITQQELSEEYSRVQSKIIVPGTSMYKDEMLAFWPEDEPRTTAAPIAPAVEDTCLFQGYALYLISFLH